MNIYTDPRTQRITLDRKHRLDVGDRVRHIDDEEGAEIGEIVALTLRVNYLYVAYPTYSIWDGIDLIEDVLCTRDLVLVEKYAKGRNKEL